MTKKELIQLLAPFPDDTIITTNGHLQEKELMSTQEMIDIQKQYLNTQIEILELLYKKYTVYEQN
jgi:hypothetical protein